MVTSHEIFILHEPYTPQGTRIFHAICKFHLHNKLPCSLINPSDINDVYKNAIIDIIISVVIILTNMKFIILKKYVDDTETRESMGKA